MPHLLDLAYTLGLWAAAPYWLLAPKARRKVREALQNRMGHPPADGENLQQNSHQNPKPGASSPSPVTVHLHAVSLGEINATRTLALELLARRDDLRLVITSTTLTGLQRAQELYQGNPRIAVERFPLDFSSAITRFLRRHRPDVSVLMELELWPNFLRLCRKREIPVLLVNGRLSMHSMKRYRLILPIARRMMRSLRLLCVQDEVYAQRFEAVGAPKDRIAVTGTMKFDTAALTVDPARVEALARETGLPLPLHAPPTPSIPAASIPVPPVLVAGSTGPGEEEILLRLHRELLQDHPTLRLVLVPRKPERFDEVAALITRQGFPLVRRSQPHPPPLATSGITPPILLGDTMGELRNFYALATIVFVGRTLVDLGPKLHGSDMIEPAALARPTIVGLYTANFADAMHLLRKNGGIREVATEAELLAELRRLLADPAERDRLGQAALRTIEQGKGATARHADRIVNLLPPLAVRPPH